MARAKKAKVKEPDFPAVVFCVKNKLFDDTEEFNSYDTDINLLDLKEGVRTPVAIYELVGVEYRTKRTTVDIE